MKTLQDIWREDKLWGAVTAGWLLTVASSYFGSWLLPIEVPGAGVIFAFRVFLPLTALGYLIFMVKRKEPLFDNVTTLEKWCYLLAAIMLVYSVVSLFRALNFGMTFRILFNLCFDLTFFVLMLRLCRDRRVLKLTLQVCAVVLIVIMLVGFWEFFRDSRIMVPWKQEYRTVYFWTKQFYPFPMAFNTNPNDYSMQLLFTSTVLLLFAVNTKRELKRWEKFSIALGGAAIYCLLIATSSRLTLLGFLILLVGLVTFLVFSGKNSRKTAMGVVCCLCVAVFANDYHLIVPPLQRYAAEMQAYREQGEPGDEKPELIWDQTEKRSWKELFYESTPETPTPETPTPETPTPEAPTPETPTPETPVPEVVLRTDTSEGVRAALLLSAWKAFKDSCGLGVGVGNTSVLAGGAAIHCFIARLAGDYGIFVLIPLCVIGCMLLAAVWKLFLAGLRRRSGAEMAYAVFVLCALLLYPFVSTTSSDAQDSIAMWLYLAAVVLIAGRELPKLTQGEADTDETAAPALTE